MTDWVALSDLSLPQDDDRVLQDGLFVCEVALPLATTAVLIDWQASEPEKRTFSIFFDQSTGIVVLHRVGNAVRRHVLPGPIPFTLGTARITYGWNLRSGKWTLGYGRIGMGEERTVVGINPIALSMAELSAICRPDGAGSRHPALLWFGVTRGKSPPERAPWVGLRTPIETLRGPVAAGNLSVGDLVFTADNGLQPILRLTRLRLPSRGSFAPVILRAPFLGQSTDMLLSADQLVVLSGAEVEYMFGLEEVLVRANALANGTIARSDSLQSSTDCIAIDLGLPELMIVDDLKFLSHGLASAEAPRKVLQAYEAQQLVSLMARRCLFGAA